MGYACRILVPACCAAGILCAANATAQAYPAKPVRIIVGTAAGGGYELARERRRISAGEIVRAALSDPEEEAKFGGDSPLVQQVVSPLVAKASSELIALLDSTTVEDLCRQADALAVFGAKTTSADFTI